ncbi:hypothetical protein IX307_001273 [Bacteroides pyogenes]|jgi:hypothetical protein|uniref:Transcriptional regulators, marR/emrR family n=2 Tax=Bacteroides pyogenes TaxID=310300 RepID=W4PKI6_9BACE|nr:outer membrane beta-barrel family protein [Bacteroides pyogenes]GAE16821.1 transcriptional regulator, MerR family [Bacteroides pyogenes JCM 6292]MBR8720061.1 hypothetical protein [Bacteroides pyogenes]MBR8786954.1 hypothetical protein [Bacteroides pyogenes]MBR8792378.1 hypothetical protein [Bacteroides pyogenes]MDY4250768.1 outer membrane beta-barrel family protein [Bacteroides pyogenes]
MERIILLVTFVFALCKVEAQTINGKIVNGKGSPIENATVVMQSVDSLYINSACSDSLGQFSILSSNLDSYRLIVQHLLYETYEKQYANQRDIIIQLNEKENSLEEVVIKGERPIVKLVEGRITYDMPLLLQGKIVSNTYESLLQLPGVREQEGNLILAGATRVTILINGQMTSMPQANLIAALKMMPYDQVQSAEIMYSTPPQYHIRGAAINIILKGGDSASEGLQGQFNTSYTQKHYSNYDAGTSLLLSKSKLTLDLNYSYNLNHTKNGVDIYSNHLYDGIVHQIEQFNRGNRKENEHDIRVGMNYKLTSKDNINIIYTSQIRHGLDNNEFSTGTFSQSNTHKGEDSPIQMHNLLLNYASGSGLKTGLEYTYYKDRTSQHFIESIESKESDFVANSLQKINKYRVFVDQSHSIGTWTLNYGAQYIYAEDHSSQQYHSLMGTDMSSSNMDSKLKEYTGNAYVGFEKTFGDKLSLSASIMGEYYKFAGFDEWTVFPAIEGTYSISPSHMMQFSLSSDKVYPGYWELHGGTSYLNGYAELQGNPNLKPYRVYSGQLSYILKSKYILTAFYNYMDDYSDQLPYQSSERLSLIYQSLNFDYRQVVGLNLMVPFNIGRVLNSRLTLNGFYDKIKSSRFHDVSFNKDNFVFYSRLNNTFNISSKPNIKMEIAGSYITKNIQGPAELSKLWNVEAGVKWSFWNDMGELRLKGTDLFNKWTPDMTMKYSTQNLKMNIIPDSRAVSLSLTLRLGDYKMHDKNVDTSRFGTK